MSLYPRIQYVVRAPLTAHIQTLYVKASMSTTTISILPRTITTYVTASVGQNYQFGNASFPMTLPYGITFASITTTTNVITSVGVPKYTTVVNSAVVGNDRLSLL